MYSEIDQAALILRRAEALLITAGAGMGVDSGLPDFRGPQGFWKAYPPYRQLGLSFAQVANPHWFDADPELAWGFYGHRLALYRQTTPHAGFATLRLWSQRLKDEGLGARVFTSNVDGHFQKAGFAAEQIVEVHGSIHHLQCTRACRQIWPADGVEVDVNPTTFRARGPLPTCPHCGSLARPNIMMFGDSRWLEQRSHAQESALESWLEELHDKRLVVIECGAGTAVPTVRRFSERMTWRQGTTLIRINLREPEVTVGHVGLAMGAADALAALDALL